MAEPSTSKPAQSQEADQQSQAAQLAGTTCMELALEGERLCKMGDFKTGVNFFEEALKVGTSDQRTLSAIYSQLGNAYFYLEDYNKALENHKQDVALVHSVGDEVAEAKACGNLGNTLKMLDKFDEAAVYCLRYLEISRKLHDTVGEGRALYNLGNVYHTKGKRMIGATASEQEPGELSNDIKSSLQKAIEYYDLNLAVVSQLQDYTSMGRAYGNLGNTHYLLGNFELAVESHKQRLELAKKTTDKSAERRAYLNLGNAHVFLGNFTEAIENYTSTLNLAQELQDKYTEAHSCYSLANTYTFLRDYKSAIFYHLKYLDMIKEFDDKLGEGRACWSLVNIYQMVNDPEKALTFAKRHHEIAELLGDKAGLVSAKLNIEELEEIISQKQASSNISSAQQQQQLHHHHHHHHHHHRQHSSSVAASDTREPAESQDQLHSSTKNRLGLSISRLTPDKRQEQEQRRFKKQLNSSLVTDIDGLASKRKARSCEKDPVRSSSSERLFDMIAHFQSGRIDDQRCDISSRSNQRTLDDKENRSSSVNSNIAPPSMRLNQASIANPISAVTAAASAIKATYRKASLVSYPTSSTAASIQAQRRPTVSAEHRDQLFDLIASSQRQRMDEQRASLPTLGFANGSLKNPRNPGLLNRGYTIDQPLQNATHSAAERHLDFALPETIPEIQTREKSHSITSASFRQPSESQTKSKTHKLTRHCQTVDHNDAQVRDEKFLDSLMKYQSTRFNDQRSEFPNRRPTSHDEKDREKGQTDNFFNLIVRFQSDRIDDQRSAPPTSSKNL